MISLGFPCNPIEVKRIPFLSHRVYVSFDKSHIRIFLERLHG
jgi:hypothetical protein